MITNRPNPLNETNILLDRLYVIRWIISVGLLLSGYPLDLTVVTTDTQNLETLRQLWELLADCRDSTQQWGRLLFTEVRTLNSHTYLDPSSGRTSDPLCVIPGQFEVAGAKEKVGRWKEQASSVALSVPTHDAVLQEVLRTVQQFSTNLPVLEKLCSPRLKEKHIKNIFKGIVSV